MTKKKKKKIVADSVKSVKTPIVASKEKFLEKNLRYPFISLSLSIISTVSAYYFNISKSYFESWYKQLNSILQDIFSVGFILSTILYFPIMAWTVYRIIKYIRHQGDSKEDRFELFILFRFYLLITIIRLGFTLVPFLYKTELVNFIVKELLPFVKIWVAKIWASVILGLLIPGLLINLIYDILKSKIPIFNRWLASDTSRKVSNQSTKNKRY